MLARGAAFFHVVVSILLRLLSRHGLAGIACHRPGVSPVLPCCTGATRHVRVAIAAGGLRAPLAGPGQVRVPGWWCTRSPSSTGMGQPSTLARKRVSGSLLYE